MGCTGPRGALEHCPAHRAFWVGVHPRTLCLAVWSTALPRNVARPRSSGGSWCFVEAVALQLVFSHSLAGGGNKYPLAHPVQRQVSSESGILKHMSACLRQLCCCVLTQMSRPVFRKADLRTVLPIPHQEQPAWPEQSWASIMVSRTSAVGAPLLTRPPLLLTLSTLPLVAHLGSGSWSLNHGS